MAENTGVGTKKYLDLWTAGKIRERYPDIGCGSAGDEDGVSREAVEGYTERKLKETLEYAIANSPFYREIFGEAAGRLFSSGKSKGQERGKQDGEDFLTQFAKLPFTTPEDLRRREMDFLCVRPGEISRIVTLDTGGSTGAPKRIYFTEADQQLAVDFFGNGMQLLVDSSDKVLILMPAKMPGSIGKLLARGLNDFGIAAVEYGLPQMGPSADGEQNSGEVNKLLALIRRERITSAVALPTHMRMLAESLLENSGNRRDAETLEDHGNEPICLKSVLLSAEYVSDADVKLIEQALGCKVYEHYGMTEMGLGCAVSCGQGDGYHIRELDLYIEIIDPETGQRVTDDRPGEVVFTTLTRKGMPFIRYRTGDYSSWITTPCQCGSVLRRISKVGPREQVKGYLR